MDEKELIKLFNQLNVAGMEKVTKLNKLAGSLINLQYSLPSGHVKLWDDNETYYGAELCKEGSDRCYGLTANEKYLLVCEYGDQGSDPEIVFFKRYR